MFEILIPVPFLVIGIAATFFRERTVEWFCRYGRATWKRTTFGLTDMAAFYQEDKARQTFRLLGPIFLCVGLLLVWVCFQAFNGPGSFAAMREARVFLEHSYGASGGWKLSSQAADSAGTVIVEYRYANRAGTLRAIWNGHHYEFTEMPPDAR